MLRQRIQKLTIYKVQAHSNIIGNDRADTLAKFGYENEHMPPNFFQENAHSTSYFLHKDLWLGNMSHTFYKGLIRHVQIYLTKHYQMFLFEYLEDKFLYISKWNNDFNIDNELYNSFWNNPQIIEAQIKQLIKFQLGQYMGNIRKNLF